MHSGLARIGFLCLLPLLEVGCGLAGPGFEDDPSDQTNSTGSCDPVIDNLEFSGDESSTLGSYIRMSFDYKLACQASIGSSTIRVHVVDLDAADPDDPSANAYYDLPMSSNYVTYDTTARTASVDYTITDETRTYEFTVTLIDSHGYLSNQLTDEVVFADVY